MVEKSDSHCDCMTLPMFSAGTASSQSWRSQVHHARSHSNVSDFSMRSPTPPSSSPPPPPSRKRAQPSPAAVTVNLHGESKTFQKPSLSFTKMIRMALEASDRGSLYLFEIYEFIRRTWPYYLHSAQGWRNSVRHALSSCRDFVHLPRDPKSNMKGSEWALNEDLLLSSEECDSASDLEFSSLPQPQKPAFNAFSRQNNEDEEMDMMEVALLTACWLRRDHISEGRKINSDLMLYNGSTLSSSPPVNVIPVENKVTLTSAEDLLALDPII